MHHRLLPAAAAAAALLVVPAAAPAAPVTVQLRVEGPTATVFEGPVTTDVRAFRFTGEAAEHVCDGTAATGGTSPVPVPVRNAALATASEQHGFALEGTFEPFGAVFTEVGGQPVAFDPVTSSYLVEYLDGAVSQLGGCSEPIVTGDDVLYAYGTGTEPLLRLEGPATAAPGSPLAVRVTAGGAPVAGATVAGAQTGADGRAIVVLAVRGPQALKASKPGTIRSARLAVCVTDGADGFCGTARPGEPSPPAPEPAPCATRGDDGLCGTTDRRAPRARILSVRDGQRFRRGRGPRLLRGTVPADPSGLRSVRLRLTRNHRALCQTWDARRERLVRMRRCTARLGRWFSAGDAAAWSYLLPRRLGPGRWVLDVRAIDRAGNAEPRLQRGRSRVVFRVR